MAQSAAESFRAREAQKYRCSFLNSHPSSSTPQRFASLPPLGDFSRKTNPSTALTAWLQLITLRMGVQRAMISLIEKDNQVFLAESTSRTKLDQNSSVEDEQADLWLGCASTPRQEALCAHTIKVQSTAGSNPFFCVEDLKQDTRFCNLPYVKNEPYFRSYGGVPLISPSGSRIGAVLVLDDRPNRTFTIEEIHFLTVIGSNVMSHLEMLQQNESRKRHALMSKGIAAFVEKKGSIPQDSQSRSDEEPQNSHTEPKAAKRTYSASGFHESVSSESECVVGKSPPSTSSAPTGDVLSRASNILCQSLDVDLIVFCDAGSSLITTSDNTADILRNTFSSVGSPLSGRNAFIEPGQVSSKHGSTNSGQASKTSAWRKNTSDGEPARVLSFSGSRKAYRSDGVQKTLSGSPKFTRRLLRKLQRRCQDGVIWSFDADGALSTIETSPLELNTMTSSSSDDSNAPENHESTKSTVCNHAGHQEASTVIKCFPGARQILFAPFPNSGRQYSSVACFAVSLHEVPIFTTDVEIAFVKAFINSVAAEMDRAESLRSNRQKGDFISSISHELRTPLHGILATTEALQDCAIDSKQRELCDSLLECSKTLHNTITHVLDYSKINKFRDRENVENQDTQSSVAMIRSQKSHQMAVGTSYLSTETKTDIALLIEEVVQSITTKASQHPTASKEVPATAQVTEGGLSTELPDLSGQTLSPLTVVPILDISNSDWTFMCEPEAIRGILEHLVENSWKYTATGFIKVEVSKYNQGSTLTRLSLGDSDTEVIIIKVIDTGQGIASNFLDKQLFMPFSQESSLSDGVGLGLSMVKGIVDSLQGTVNIGSVPNAGTVIEVRLPLKRAIEPVSIAAPTIMPSASGHQREIEQARAQCSDITVKLLGFDLTMFKPLRNSIRVYTEHWFGAKIVLPSADADLSILNLLSVGSFADLRELSNPRRPLIICCHTADLAGLNELQSHAATKFIPLVLPLGPVSLARAILRCFRETISTTTEQDQTTVASEKIPDASKPVKATSSEAPLQDPAKMPSRDGKSQRRSFTSRRRESKTSKATEPTSTGPSKDDATRRKSSTQPRVLCVDDNDVNLQILTRYMTKLQLEDVETARDGYAAYQRFEQDPQGFDVIFMDLSMPVWDGFESTRAIRKLERKRRKESTASTPPVATIIVVTALASEQDRENAFRAGADLFLTKPLKLADVRNLMQGQPGDTQESPGLDERR